MRLFSMLRERHPCSSVFIRGSKKGSALLIVLGFLSFMVISGVSFAIFMRIERQAASNYRHSVTARHLLNAALARAMDEVDSELRIKDDQEIKWASIPEQPEDEKVQVKFPKWKDWPGRVKVSASLEKADNGEDARVLSLEALSFLPGVLLNDVRRFAKWDERDSKERNYMGAKWLPLERSIDEALVGRYAYVCVNVSDMLDVNQCRASLPRNSYTNHVSMGHLLGDLNGRQKFDGYVNKDRLYLSLQDFYTAHYYRKGQTPTEEESPYHEYITTGANGLATFGADSTRRHTFITDSFVKAEPPYPGALNIFLNQPMDRNLLNNERPAMRDHIVFSSDLWWERFQRITADNNFIGSLDKNRWAAVLKDYLDEDGIVCDLGAPSVELAPMISLVAFNDNLLKAELYLRDETRPKSGPGGGTVTGRRCTFRILTAGSFSQGFPVNVLVAWPFKYFEEKLQLRDPKFKMEGVWIFTLTKDGEKVTADIVGEPNRTVLRQEWKSEITDIDTAMFSEAAIQVNQDKCYKNFTLEFKTPINGQNEIELLDFDEDGTALYPSKDTIPVEEMGNLRVEMTFLIRIYDGAGNLLTRPVDQVPCEIDIGQFSYNEMISEWGQTGTRKLYFKTQLLKDNNKGDHDPSKWLTGTIPADSSILYAAEEGWNSLEVPDPRFNYSPANWIASKMSGTSPAEEMPQSTKYLLGLDGRDNDIFMSVSDAGYMQSPGELGFVIRPYIVNTTTDIDFEKRQSINELNGNNSDFNAMFRTVRLYDHGGKGPNQRRDFVYNNFYVAKADDSLPGPRVNPFSDLKDNDRSTVREAALIDTPLDYYFASTNKDAVALSKDLNDNDPHRATLDRRLFNSHEAPRQASRQVWEDFVDEWSKSFDEAWYDNNKPRTIDGQAQRSNGNANSRKFKIATEWRSNLSDIYGDWEAFKWYDDDSGQNQTKIFENGSLSKPLHEIDRKMLYSFSLDSFSDRQQLFLYFIRAETAMPTLGAGSGGSGGRSLAGGRAVALVWRDPYPRDYEKPWPESTGTEPWTTKNGNNGWYPDLTNYKSPWEQYYSGSRSRQRWDGWHDTRILFFKQLD